MTEDELQGLVADLRGAANARGATIRVELGTPVSQEALNRCSEFMHRGLPHSIVALLSTWNGITIYYYDASNMLGEQPDRWSVKFRLLSAESMLKATAGVRDYFDLATPDPVERASSEKLVSNVLVVSQEEDFVRYVTLEGSSDLTAPESPVMALDLQYFDDWLEDQGRPIAASLDEYLRRSLQYMARSGKHFYYWLD